MVRKLFDQAIERLSWRFSRYSTIYRAYLYRPLLRKVQFVAITGTAGKTTVKDLSASILSQFGPTKKTNDSNNGPDAVAKNVLSVRPADRFCVLEVSGAKPGLLTWPLRVVRPNIAVITLIEKEHAGANFTVEDIASEKARLVKALPRDGTAILNIDDPRLAALKTSLDCRVIWVGKSEEATIRLLHASSNWPEALTFTVSYDGATYNVPTQLHGVHLAVPALSSLAVAVASGQPLDKALAALKNIKPSEGRMQPVEVGGVTFMRDDWKAPLWSLDAPFAFMKDATARRKLMVIGTISDYSLSASKLYPKIARQALEAADIVVFVGPHALRAAKKATEEQKPRIKAFADLKPAAEFLRQELQQGDLVLLKASNRADHLVRLIYDIESPIKCWRTRCGKSQFCGSCDMLYKEQPSARNSAPSHAHNGDLASMQLNATPALILIGLGNSGTRFHNTRHNTGFLMLDHLALSQEASWIETENGSSCLLSLSGTNVLLLKPKGAINHSGHAIAGFLNGTTAPMEQCVVVHDDVDLVLGDARLKRGGGDGGHLGVRSVIETFNTGDFTRIRIGVRAEGDSRPARLIATELLSEPEQVLQAAGLAKARDLLHTLERDLGSLPEQHQAGTLPLEQ